MRLGDPPGAEHHCSIRSNSAGTSEGQGGARQGKNSYNIRSAPLAGARRVRLVRFWRSAHAEDYE